MSAAVNKRTTESKYVSMFADSRPDLDVTFRDPLLTRPTSHYLVGVDNFTVCSRALSMIEPVSTSAHEDLIRIVRKPTQHAAGGTQRGLAIYANSTAQLPGGDVDFVTNIATASITWLDIRQDLVSASISSSDQITSVGHLMERLQTIAGIVNSAMSKNTLAIRSTADVNAQQVNTFTAYTSPQAEQDAANGAEGAKDHLQFRLSRSGKLVIEGTKAFWAVCAVEVPSVQNQFGFFGSTKTHEGPFYSSTGRRFLTVDAAVGTFSFSNMVGNRSVMATAPRVTVIGQVFHSDGSNTSLQGNGNFDNGAQAVALEKIAVTLDGNLFLGLDRRVAIELGTSLPISNSPMVAHQEESPDFVIGRWIYRSDMHYQVNDKGEQSTYGVDASATREYQSPQDRVVFHALMPQSKVQTLRITVFARVRTFDADLETYNVRVIKLPTNPEDWWHGRLHFVSKD